MSEADGKRDARMERLVEGVSCARCVALGVQCPKVVKDAAGVRCLACLHPVECHSTEKPTSLGSDGEGGWHRQRQCKPDSRGVVCADGWVARVIGVTWSDALHHWVSHAHESVDDWGAHVADDGFEVHKRGKQKRAPSLLGNVSGSLSLQMHRRKKKSRRDEEGKGDGRWEKDGALTTSPRSREVDPLPASPMSSSPLMEAISDGADEVGSLSLNGAMELELRARIATLEAEVEHWKMLYETSNRRSGMTGEPDGIGKMMSGESSGESSANSSLSSITRQLSKGESCSSITRGNTRAKSRSGLRQSSNTPSRSMSPLNQLLDRTGISITLESRRSSPALMQTPRRAMARLSHRMSLGNLAELDQVGDLDELQEGGGPSEVFEAFGALPEQEERYIASVGEVLEHIESRVKGVIPPTTVEEYMQAVSRNVLIAIGQLMRKLCGLSRSVAREVVEANVRIRVREWAALFLEHAVVLRRVRQFLPALRVMQRKSLLGLNVADYQRLIEKVPLERVESYRRICSLAIQQFLCDGELMEVSEVVAAERALSGVGATLPDDLTDWLSSSIEMELKAGLQPSECRHGIRTYKYSIPVAVFEKGTMQNGRAYVFSDVAVVAPDESSDFPARKFLFSTLVRVQSGDSLCAYERRLTAMPRESLSSLVQICGVHGSLYVVIEEHAQREKFLSTMLKLAHESCAAS